MNEEEIFERLDAVMSAKSLTKGFNPFYIGMNSKEGLISGYISRTRLILMCLEASSACGLTVQCINNRKAILNEFFRIAKENYESVCCQGLPFPRESLKLRYSEIRGEKARRMFKLLDKAEGM